MDSSLTCQLYKYDPEFFLITKDTPAYFAAEFVKGTLDEDYVSWLNFHSLDDRKSIQTLCEHLDIELLSVEDIYTEKRRPKLEEYPHYMFFSVRSALPIIGEGEGLEQEQVSFILGKNYLISFQEKSSDHFTDVRDRIEKKRGKIRFKGPDFLLFRMLEAIIDNYFEVLEGIDESIQLLEKKLVTLKDAETLKLIETEKRKLVELRKIVLPVKEVTSHLEKLKGPFLDADNHHYFADLKENCSAVLEDIDANKQILEGMANLYYAVQGQRMNEIMKVLTVVSSIFIPLTFIVGVYGMNFEHMPELKMKYGYGIVWAVMGLVGVSMTIYFIRKGWLWNKKK
ncbi:MAG: magnesium/cobalt transporter CorA [Flavobacteriia bacterium]